MGLWEYQNSPDFVIQGCFYYLQYFGLVKGYTKGILIILRRNLLDLFRYMEAFANITSS